MLTIIGGAGFIGSALCRNLHDRGNKFEILDLKTSHLFPKETKICDVRDKDQLLRSVSGESIINLAAVHRDNVTDHREYYRTNVDGASNVCEVADIRGIRSVHFTSTVAVYGFAPANTTEMGEIRPFNHYGKSKYEAEQILRDWYSRSPNKTVSIIRPTAVFGLGNRGNVFNLLRQIADGKFVMIGKGENRKSLAYVENIAAFIEFVVEKAEGLNTINYVDKPDFNMNELVSEVRLALGRSPTRVRLPQAVGNAAGMLADALSLITGKEIPLSSIRVKKFCSETTFSSEHEFLSAFNAPYNLREALKTTISGEFISPDPDRVLYFTE